MSVRSIFRSVRLVSVGVISALAAACGGSSAPALAPAPAPVPSPWTAVDQAAATAFAASSGISGMTLAVFDRNDVKVFEKNYGAFSATQRVPVGSASKIVAGPVLLRLVGQGLLSLDSTTAQVLGWSGVRGTITLRHLLSFTSGLTPNAACINNPSITLAACVNQIRDDPNALLAAPGVRYDYGSTHLQVAARMAEVVTGKTWNAIFAEQLGAPLGLPADSTFFTLAEQQVGTINPRVAGGLSTTLDQFARILAISFHRGTYKGFTYAPAALFDAQAVEPYPGVTIGVSPYVNIGLPYRYGLAAWLECDTPATGCSTIASPGAFGWTPWVDRANGYYAILGMYKGGLDDNGVVDFSVNLAQQLKPLIVRALNP
jgi:CubicO group peptidase (beta-lactamase class C family)